MFGNYNIKNYNFRLIVYVTALSILGIIVIRSAAAGDMSSVYKQIVGIIAGTAIMLVLSVLSYEKLLKLSSIIYALCIILLLGVIFMGRFGGGARRWIVLPLIGRFQPSEFVKFGMTLCAAWILSKYRNKIDIPKYLMLFGAYVGIPILLIFIEPDLSTSIVLFTAMFAMLFVSGISYKKIFIILAILAACIIITIICAESGMIPFLRDYQLNRISAFLNPDANSDLTLQQTNSMMAIGSGQLFGKGLFNTTIVSVKNGNFLSQEQTDFIFAVLGEEMGFVGSFILILLYILTIFECMHTASKCKEFAGRLICIGVASVIGIQSFINLAVATGIFPNTGLPLPFISYGVSSLMSMYIGIGLVLNVGLSNKVIPDKEEIIYEYRI